MGTDHTAEEKLSRLRHGEAPRVVDLFAGCGGVSLGFQRAGCRILGGVECDAGRAQTYAANLHRDATDDDRAFHATARDAATTDPLAWMRTLPDHDGTGPDIIVGGPPCQAYSRAGRAKLREIARHPRAFRHDPRGKLYAAYVAFVAALRPVAVLMENVPDILNYGGKNVGEAVAQSLEELGYTCRYTLLNAAHYGVPQTRERWYLIGYHRTVRLEPQFPSPSHFVALPHGYRSTRAFVRALHGPDHARFVEPPTLSDLAANNVEKAVNCEDALSDLAALASSTRGGSRPFRPCLASLLPYAAPPRTGFQRAMREWPGMATDGAVTGHVTRWLPRDGPIFRQMPEGADYPVAFQVAMRIFGRRLAGLRRRGATVREGSARWLDLLADTVPPYDPGKFPNKWRKLERSAPARTLMAHLSHDTYSHIHYDSEQARTISVREAARLQSFPDGFAFAQGMNAAFGQIGNAVPPIMAWHLARSILDQLRDAPSVRERDAGESAAHAMFGARVGSTPCQSLS